VRRAQAAPTALHCRHLACAAWHYLLPRSTLPTPPGPGNASTYNVSAHLQSGAACIACTCGVVLLATPDAYDHTLCQHHCHTARRALALHCAVLQTLGVSTAWHCVSTHAVAYLHSSQHRSPPPCPHTHHGLCYGLPALRCRHLVSTAWRYLDLHGHINWGVAPAIMARPSPQRQETVVVIGAGLAGGRAGDSLINGCVTLL
jgi:hypothetical protein